MGLSLGCYVTALGNQAYVGRHGHAIKHCRRVRAGGLAGVRACLCVFVRVHTTQTRALIGEDFDVYTRQQSVTGDSDCEREPRKLCGTTLGDERFVCSTKLTRR